MNEDGAKTKRLPSEGGMSFVRGVLLLLPFVVLACTASGLILLYSKILPPLIDKELYYNSNLPPFARLLPWAVEHSVEIGLLWVLGGGTFLLLSRNTDPFKVTSYLLGSALLLVLGTYLLFRMPLVCLPEVPF